MLRTLRSWHAIAALIVAAAAVATLVRLPAAIDAFNDRAEFNATQDALGRQIAGADAEEIDNEFLAQALTLIPADAPYAIVLSQSPAVARGYRIKAATYHALPAFVQNALLPRRQVPVGDARYVLCYACDTDPLDPRMQRLWENDQGLVIGRLSG
jgi:hypothetical protein